MVTPIENSDPSGFIAKLLNNLETDQSSAAEAIKNLNELYNHHRDKIAPRPFSIGKLGDTDLPFDTKRDLCQLITQLFVGSYYQGSDREKLDGALQHLFSRSDLPKACKAIDCTVKILYHAKKLQEPFIERLLNDEQLRESISQILEGLPADADIPGILKLCAQIEDTEVHSALVPLMSILPQNQRSVDTLNGIIKLLPSGADGKPIADISLQHAILKIDRKLRSEAILKAYPFMQGITEGEARAAILKAAGQVLPELNDDVTTALQAVSDGHIRAAILTAVCLLPKALQTDVTATIALMQSSKNTAFILQGMRLIPAVQRTQSLIANIHTVLMGIIDANNQNLILESIEALPEEQRNHCLDIAHYFIETNTTKQERIGILNLISLIPREQCLKDNRFISLIKDVADCAPFLDIVKKIPINERKTIIDRAISYFSNSDDEELKVDILKTIHALPEHTTTPQMLASVRRITDTSLRANVVSAFCLILPESRTVAMFRNIYAHMPKKEQAGLQSDIVSIMKLLPAEHRCKSALRNIILLTKHINNPVEISKIYQTIERVPPEERKDVIEHAKTLVEWLKDTESEQEQCHNRHYLSPFLNTLLNLIPSTARPMVVSQTVQLRHIDATTVFRTATPFVADYHRRFETTLEWQKNVLFDCLLKDSLQRTTLHKPAHFLALAPILTALFDQGCQEDVLCLLTQQDLNGSTPLHFAGPHEMAVTRPLWSKLNEAQIEQVFSPRNRAGESLFIQGMWADVLNKRMVVELSGMEFDPNDIMKHKVENPHLNEEDLIKSAIMSYADSEKDRAKALHLPMLMGYVDAVFERLEPNTQRAFLDRFTPQEIFRIFSTKDKDGRTPLFNPAVCKSAGPWLYKLSYRQLLNLFCLSDNDKKTFIHDPEILSAANNLLLSLKENSEQAYEILFTMKDNDGFTPLECLDNMLPHPPQKKLKMDPLLQQEITIAFNY